MSVIGTRLADDFALAKQFNKNKDFKQWESGLLSRRSANASRYNVLISSAESAARRVKESADVYKTDNALYNVFLEGMQYGYHDNSDWHDEDSSRAASSSMSSVLGHLSLSGKNENVLAWKKTLKNTDERTAGKAGYSAGSNLRKNVDSVATTKPELVDYFTIFSLEYQFSRIDDQTNIGDILSDITRATTSNVNDVSDDAIGELAIQTAKKLVLFFKTHHREEFQSFLRGFNAGYTNPGTKRPEKRSSARSETDSKKRTRRITSLYSDIEDSQTIRLIGKRHDDALLQGETLGRRFRHQLSAEDVDRALVLLSRYYSEEMTIFEKIQRYPILTARTSVFLPLFFNNVNLKASLTREEFVLFFGSVSNTIDSDDYRTKFSSPDLVKNTNDRIDIFEQLFDSSYGVNSMKRNGGAIETIVEKIAKSSSAEVIEAMKLSVDEIELLTRVLLSQNESLLDEDYVPSPAQRELDNGRACEFYAQAAVAMNERETRDVETIIFTPLLINTMAEYVEMTSSLGAILAVFAERTPLDPQIRNFLELYVETKNKQWIANRVKIAKGVLFSKKCFDVVSNACAADVAHYLRNDLLATSRGLQLNVIMKYGSQNIDAIDESVSEEVYKRTATYFGVEHFLKSNTSNLFNWLRISTNEYWPVDVAGMQQVVHDVIMLHYLQYEMAERAAMVSSVLFFDNVELFTRWDLLNFLVQKENEGMSARELVEFTQKAKTLVSLFTNNSSSNIEEETSSGDVYDDITKLQSLRTAINPLPSTEIDFFSGITKEEMEDFYDYDPKTNKDVRVASDDNFGWSDDLDPFGEDVIGAKMCASSSSQSQAIRARQQGVVIRSTPIGSSLDKSDTDCFGAFKDHSFGEKIGCAVYSRKCKKIVAIDARDTEQIKVSALLKDYICEMYPDATPSIGDTIAMSSEQSLLETASQFFELIIDATINYRPTLAGSGKERPHGIYFYPSSSYASSEPIFVSAEEAMSGKRMTLRYNVVKEYIPGHAMFNIDSYALYTDSGEETGINQSGFASCRLADLKQGRGVKLTLIVPNSEEKRAKGDIMLTVHSMSLPINATPSVSCSGDLDREKALTQKRIRQYINENKKFYKLHPNSVASVQNITVFEYACRDGIIPGSMFDSFKLASSDDTYYLQTLKFAVARRRPDIEAFNVDDWVNFDEDEKVHILMDVLRMYVNYCPYIRDLADDNVEGQPWNKRNVELIESFDYIRQRDAGDCEDFTREIIQTAMEIKYNLKYSQSIAIQELRRIANMFVFASILCGVSREAMSLAELSKGNVSLHGHECAVAIPNYIFFEALKRHDADNVVLSLHTEEELNAGAGKKIFILEGTGCLFPEARDKPARFASIQRDFNSKCKEVARHVSDMVFYNPCRDNTFYKQMISILTPEFFLRTGHTGFEFIVCRKTAAGTFRGVPFSLLLDIDANEDVLIIPAPVIPVDVFHVATRLDADNFPPIPLRSAAMTTQMREVCDTLTTRRPLREQDFFQFQIRFRQMTAARVEKLKKFAASKKLDLLCLAEPVKMSASSGDCVGGYTILMF